LIVEDDERIRESLKELLEEHGYEVVCAEHGAHALELLRDAVLPPVLILLDIAMPVMDGLAFRAAQLADPTLAAIPVVVMTADGRVEEKRVRAACKHGINKPMDVQQLLDIVAFYT
jgi:CheY-like chemotaxis protein